MSLPSAVLDRARQALLDTVAVQLAGTRTEAFGAVLSLARSRPGDAPVLGTAVRTTPEWAAHAQAVAASVLDFDDGHYEGGGIHAGSTVLPALLATSADDLPLEALLPPLVSGYEAAIRFGYLNSPAVTGEGYRASGYAAGLGATVALAEAARLDTATAATALRTARSHAPHSAFVSGGARESIGWAAATAVVAVELATAGFGNDRDDSAGATPGSEPLGRLFAAHPFTASYGSVYESLRCYTKPYAACRAAHAMLDALLSLPVDAARVDRITVAVVPGAAGLAVTRPTSLSQAQFALPWLAAVALLRGGDALTALDPADFGAADVVALATRVRLVAEAQPGAHYPAHVRVEQFDGTVLDAAVDHALGSPERPLSPAALRAKAAGALGRTLHPAAATALIDLVTGGAGTVGRLRELAAEGRQQ